jgi:hypothetical protein
VARVVVCFAELALSGGDAVTLLQVRKDQFMHLARCACAETSRGEGARKEALPQAALRSRESACAGEGRAITRPERPRVDGRRSR